MPKQQVTFDELARKLAEVVGSKSAKTTTLTTPAGDAGTQGGQAFDNPLTTIGDLIAGGESGALTRLGIGTEGQVLTVFDDGTDLVAAWQDAVGGAGGSDYLYWTADSSATEPVWLMSDGRLLRR